MQAVSVTATTITTLVSSQSPSAAGQPVTFAATVTPNGSGTPTGSITFTDQSTNQSLGNIPLNGN